MSWYEWVAVILAIIAGAIISQNLAVRAVRRHVKLSRGFHDAVNDIVVGVQDRLRVIEREGNGKHRAGWTKEQQVEFRAKADQRINAYERSLKERGGFIMVGDVIGTAPDGSAIFRDDNSSEPKAELRKVIGVNEETGGFVFEDDLDAIEAAPAKAAVVGDSSWMHPGPPSEWRRVQGVNKETGHFIFEDELVTPDPDSVTQTGAGWLLPVPNKIPESIPAPEVEFDPSTAAETWRRSSCRELKDSTTLSWGDRLLSPKGTLWTVQKRIPVGEDMEVTLESRQGDVLIVSTAMVKDMQHWKLHPKLTRMSRMAGINRKVIRRGDVVTPDSTRRLIILDLHHGFSESTYLLVDEQDYGIAPARLTHGQISDWGRGLITTRHRRELSERPSQTVAARVALTGMLSAGDYVQDPRGNRHRIHAATYTDAGNSTHYELSPTVLEDNRLSTLTRFSQKDIMSWLWAPTFEQLTALEHEAWGIQLPLHPAFQNPIHLTKEQQ